MGGERTGDGGPTPLQFQTVLLRLGAEVHTPFRDFLHRVLRADAELLGVERVSYWAFSEDGARIRCTTLFQRTTRAFGGGEEFEGEKVPAYFDAMREQLVVVADDAHHDPRTREFCASYLAPLGITSMLDVPVWLNGQLAGVICHEHVGPARRWRADEQAFAVSMGQFVSMGLEREERLKAELGLRDALERLTVLSETAQDFALVVLDPKGQIRTASVCSPGFLPETVAGTHHTVLYPPRDVERGRPQRALLKAATHGRHEEQGWLMRQDGSRFWARIVVRALRDEDGQLRGFATVAQDLTSARLARQNVRLLARTQKVADSQRLLVRLSAANAASLNTGRILSRTARLLLEGFADDCSLNLNELLRPDDARRVIVSRSAVHQSALEALTGRLADPRGWGEALSALVLQGRAVFFPRLGPEQLPLLTQDEEAQGIFRQLLPASLISVPIKVRRRVLGTLTLLRHREEARFDKADLALAKEVAQRVGYAVDNARLYELAREAIRARDEFISVAAHELRTPLTTLQLQIQLLDRDLRDPRGGGRSDRHLHVTRRQVQRLGTLVNELLDLSRVTAGKLELKREAVSLSELVREVIEAYSEDAARADCALSADLEPDLLGRWDAGRLEQVVTNLLSNAIKYGRGRPVHVTLRSDREDAYLSVEDHGPGIAPEDQQRIFGRFERASPTRHFGGLGLGLYIVRRIVGGHGGEIRVSSALGRGTTFTVRLPRWTAVDIAEQVPVSAVAEEEEPPSLH